MAVKSIQELIVEDKVKYPAVYQEEPKTKFVLDVSEHQADIKWDSVFENPYIVGVNVRASCGYRDDIDTNIDDKFQRNCEAVLSAGKALGCYVYLFATPNLDKLYRQLDHFQTIIEPFKDNMELGIYLDWEDRNLFGIDYLPSWYWYSGNIKTMIESKEYDNYTSKSKFDQITGSQIIKPYSGYGKRWIAQYYWGYKDVYNLKAENNYGIDILRFYSTRYIGKPLDLINGKQNPYQAPSIPSAWLWSDVNRYWDIWQISEMGLVPGHINKFDTNIINQSHPMYSKLVLGIDTDSIIADANQIVNQAIKRIRRWIYHEPYKMM